MNKLQTSDVQIAALDKAGQIDQKSSVVGTSNYTVAALNLAAVSDRSQMLLARRPSITMALAAKKAAAKIVDEAVAKAKALHEQYKQLTADNRRAMRHNVDKTTRELVSAASEKLMAGDATALDGLESAADISSRFETERHAVHESIRQIGHQMVPEAVAAGNAIDSALADLAERLEKRDLEDCEAFGIEPAWSSTTQLIQGCRVQFHRQVIHNLKALAALAPGAPCSPCFKPLFEDFIDLSSWS